jgi:hypothetical protein
MNLLKKAGLNSVLLAVLFALLTLPMGAIGLTVYKPDAEVMSSTDYAPEPQIPEEPAYNYEETRPEGFFDSSVGETSPSEEILTDPEEYTE